MVIYLPNDHVGPLVGLIRRLVVDGRISTEEKTALDAVKRSMDYEVKQKPFKIFQKERERQKKVKTLRPKLTRRKTCHVDKRKA